MIPRPPQMDTSRPRIRLDYETRIPGEADRYLRDHGPYLYVEHPAFEAILLSIHTPGAPTRVIEGAETIREVTRWFVETAERGEAILVAHNSMFDRLVASRVLGMPQGEYLNPALWDDTMPRAHLAGLPANLAGLAEALGGPEKMAEGKDLISLFGGSPESTETLKHRHPEEWETFKAYATRDVDALIYADDHLSWPRSEEVEGWILDQRINDRGIAVDQDYCWACLLYTSDAADEL